ncbi:MAG: 8-oxo-dGTP diphosphatase [Clostridia bacterium]|nr:8-oxo-dGTP diphosphatase [Clostridia bacterium]
MVNTTLCYIEKDGAYLMLHRVKKENDLNRDKWVGIGGKLEAGESPHECAMREIKEETGLVATDLQYRGLVTFVSEKYGTEYMHLFTVKSFSGDLIDDCNEGVLEWVDKSQVTSLPIWEGDKIFLDLLNSETRFFSLKLVYDKDDALVSSKIDI